MFSLFYNKNIQFNHIIKHRNAITCPHGMNRVAAKPSYSEFTLIYKKYSPYYI